MVRLTSTCSLWPLLKRMKMKVTSLLRSTFTQLCGFESRLGWEGVGVACANEVPCPEKLMYFGGGGSSYCSPRLSARATFKPFGCFARSSEGTTLSGYCILPLSQFFHELLAFSTFIISERAIVHNKTILVQGYLTIWRIIWAHILFLTLSTIY